MARDEKNLCLDAAKAVIDESETLARLRRIDLVAERLTARLADPLQREETLANINALVGKKTKAKSRE